MPPSAYFAAGSSEKERGKGAAINLLYTHTPFQIECSPTRLSHPTRTSPHTITAVDLSAKTLASLYYGSVLTQEPTKDLIVGVDSSSTDQKFTVGDFNKQVVGYAVGMLEGLGLKRGCKVGVWMTGELEHVVVRLAAGLLGVEVVVIDPAVGFEGAKGLVASEGLHALILSPRFASQDRHAALRTQFDHELGPNQDGQLTGTHGIFPLTSKRFRTLKYLVCTSTEFADEAGPLYGVVRFANLPVYGPCEYWGM